MSATPDLPDIGSLWNFQHPDSTEARFREILPAAAASGDTGYEVELLTQIARTEGLQRKFEDAQRTLDRAEELLRSNPAVAAAPRPRMRLLLERGRVLNSSGHPDSSVAPFLEAWEIGRRAGEDALAIDAAHMLGIVESDSAAIEWNRRAMAAAEASSDPKARGWLGPLYNNLGWTYHDRGEYETALELFRKGLEFRRERGQVRETRIALWTVARTLRSLGRVEEALSMERDLLEQWRAAGEEDGYVYEEIGECLLALGRPEEARPHFADAYRLLSTDPWLAEKEPERLARLAKLGGLEESGERPAAKE